MRFGRWARELATNWRDLDWWYRRPRNFVLQRTIGTYFDFVGPDGTAVADEDWDYLLLLDGCRYDMFAEHNTLDGRLEARTSKGSATPEFLQANFGDRRLYDTIYVTANPQYRLHLDDVFHAVVDVWREEWNTDFNTVMPEPMADAVELAAKRYPRKRILAHFMQPHYPFIGETGQSIESQSGIGASRQKVLGDAGSGKSGNGDGDERINVWRQYRMGHVDEQTLRQAYVENLKLVLQHVERLTRSLEGKLVVTSDHGNMIGEFAWPFPVRLYGHPPGIHAPPLVRVPWLVVESGVRRSVTQEVPSRTFDQTTDEDVTHRLEQLGYVE